MNNNGTLAVDDATATLKVNGEDFPPTKKISDLQNLELTRNASDFTTTGFLMMNAPLASVKGGETSPTGAEISVASKIDKDHIYATEALAKANSSASIYVERALAKVDVTASKPTGNLEDGAKYHIQLRVGYWIIPIKDLLFEKYFKFFRVALFEDYINCSYKALSFCW